METEVLIVGAGPVGLMAAIELRRRGIDVVIVDKRSDVAPWAKAVGVQPRTLEIFDSIGIARAALDRAIAMRGQLIYVNGEQLGRIDVQLPEEIPYHFVSLPQYCAEEVLGDHLVELGTTVRRGVEVVDVAADDDRVIPGRRRTARRRRLPRSMWSARTVRAASSANRRGSPSKATRSLRNTCWPMCASTGTCPRATRSARCTRPTVSPTTYWCAYRCRGRADTGCRCSCPTSFPGPMSSMAFPPADAHRNSTTSKPSWTD